MADITFELRWLSGEQAPDLGDVRAIAPLRVQTKTVADERIDEFDARYRSDTTIIQVASWAVSSGALAACGHALKSTLVAYLHSRRAELELTVGKTKIKIQGPLSGKQIDALVDKAIKDQKIERISF